MGGGQLEVLNVVQPSHLRMGKPRLRGGEGGNCPVGVSGEGPQSLAEVGVGA